MKDENAVPVQEEEITIYHLLLGAEIEHGSMMGAVAAILGAVVPIEEFTVYANECHRDNDIEAMRELVGDLLDVFHGLQRFATRPGAA